MNQSTVIYVNQITFVHSCSHVIFVAVMLQYVCEWLSMKVSFHSVHRVDTTLMKYFF